MGAFRETHEVVFGEYTSYRIIPNPDASPEEGWNAGVVLQWKDTHDKEWQDHFFIAPDCISTFAEIFTEIKGKL